MTATKYKEEAKLEIEKSCLETMIAKREMTISQFEINYKAIRSMLPLRSFTELPSTDDATLCSPEQHTAYTMLKSPDFGTETMPLLALTDTIPMSKAKAERTTIIEVPETAKNGPKQAIN